MTTTADVTSGTITFVSHHEPPLPDGDFEIVVGQRVRSTSAGFDEVYLNRTRVRVEGPRFTLPPDQLVARFPPADGSGEYAAVLPHVVLARKTLAWERSPFVDDHVDGTPWLALLVFHESDAAAGSSAPWTARSVLVSDLATPPADTLSYPDPAPSPGEPADDRCQVIDVPVALWGRVAPTAAELRLLAHAREVDSPAPAESCVVVANRLPHPNARTIVHLVSLEGLADRLPGSPGAPSAGTVRVVSLLQWSFASLDPVETFTGYLEGLSLGPLQLPALPSDGSSSKVVERAVTLGYSPKPHRLRSGETTLSWYRGPLLPYAAPSPGGASSPPASVSEDLLRYDPDSGMLDVSYAAAFELGRLLTLADTGVATALATWKHDNLHQAALALEREVLDERLGAFLDLSGDAGTGVGAAGRAALAELDLRPARARKGSRAERESWQRGDHADAFAALVRDPRTWQEDHSTVAVTPLPSRVTRWLAGLRLLTGVPAAYLLPDALVLPPESLRVVDVDPDWVRALVDGAFAIGRTSRAVGDHDMATHRLVLAAPPVPGSDSDSGPDGPPPVESATITGFLIRSRLISGWPLLEVRAFDTDDVRLPMLRMERISSTVLLYLAAGRIARVEIAEAPQGLHFGMRRSDEPGDPRMHRATPTGEVEVPFRPGTDGVVDIWTLADLVGARLDSATFARAMIEGSEAVEIIVSDPSGADA